MADLGFWVKLDSCDNCSPDFKLQIEYTSLSSTNGGSFVDVNTTNNTDDYSHSVNTSANPLCNDPCANGACGGGLLTKKAVLS